MLKKVIFEKIKKTGFIFKRNNIIYIFILLFYFKKNVRWNDFVSFSSLGYQGMNRNSTT